MYIVVVGVGNLGYYLCQLLLEEEHDVVVVDKRGDRCDRISHELDIVATQGDATDPAVLGNANIKEADAVVSLTGQDETNMVVSLLAKELGAKQVAARISRIEYDEKILKKLGIDIVIHPEAAAAGYIEELITKPGVLDLAFISRGEAEIMEIEVKSKSRAAGKKTGEISLPEGSAIVALYQNGNLVIPSKETMIEVGDKMLVLAKREISEKAEKMLD